MIEVSGIGCRNVIGKLSSESYVGAVRKIMRYVQEYLSSIGFAFI